MLFSLLRKTIMIIPRKTRLVVLIFFSSVDAKLQLGKQCIWKQNLLHWVQISMGWVGNFDLQPIFTPLGQIDCICLWWWDLKSTKVTGDVKADQADRDSVGGLNVQLLERWLTQVPERSGDVRQITPNLTNRFSSKNKM